MKIDLNGRYKDIVGYLDAPNRAQGQVKAKEGFQTLLSDVAPEKAQQPVKTKLIAPESPVAIDTMAADDEVMASIKRPEPTLLQPQMAKMLAPESPLIPEKAEDKGVKSPTILGASRIAGQTEVRASLAMPKNVEMSIPKTPDLGIPPQLSDRGRVVSEIVGRLAPEQGIDPHLGMAVARAESNFNPRAVSSDGHYSKGLFQLLDSTAENIIERDGLKTNYRPFEPEQNAELGIRYLRYLHDLFSKESSLPNNLSTYPAANSASLEKLAVAAYNAGEGRVASAQDRAARQGLDPKDYTSIAPYLPDSTQDYVQKVISFKEGFDLEMSAEIDGEY